jgi:hypothetical protein
MCQHNMPPRIEGDLAWLGLLAIITSGAVWAFVLWYFWPFMWNWR